MLYHNVYIVYIDIFVDRYQLNNFLQFFLNNNSDNSLIFFMKFSLWLNSETQYITHLARIPKTDAILKRNIVFQENNQ